MSEAYTDLLIHIRRRQDAASPYQVEASLSDGSFFFGHLHLDEEALLEAEQRFDLEAYGEILFEALLAGSIGRAYDLASGIARDDSDGQLRVRLWLDDQTAGLQTINWERLYHYHQDQLLPLATTVQTPFSRYTGLGIAEPRAIKRRPLRLLVAIANPSDLKSDYDLEPVDIPAEIESLRQSFGDLLQDKKIQVTILPGQSGLPEQLSEELLAEGYQIENRRTTLANLLRRLSQFHIYHFIGHGAFRPGKDGDEGTAVLYMEKLDGTCDLVKDDELVAKFSAAGQLPHLLFLVACESAKTEIGRALTGLAPKLVQAGLPAVVAMQDKIFMSAAQQFTADFYAGLLQHGIVDRATNEARHLLYEDGEGAWATPVLFMRLRTGQLFAADPFQAALEAMSRYEKFNFFSEKSARYVPMPIEVIHLTGDQDYGNLERLGNQVSATIEILKAVVDTISDDQQRQSERPKLVALLGGFGANKSTQLKRIAWETIRGSLEDPGPRRLPVYVELQNYQPVRSTLDNPMEGQVLASLGQFWPELESRSLGQLPTEPQLRILFYGTDSLPDADRVVAVEQIQTLMMAYPQYEYVLASRPTAIDWSQLDRDIDLHLLVIQPLNPTRIRHFLENLGPVEALGRLSVAARKQTGRKLLKEIYRSQLFDLVATPRFMFEVLRQAQRGVYPSSRTEALHQWVEGSLALIAPGQGMRAHAADTIYSLAWEMQLARREVWPVIDAFRIMGAVRGSRGYDLETLYRDYLEHDLLDEVGELSLRFTYLPVQAYCCAKAIMASNDRERILGDITSMLGTATRLRWWEETLAFICGLMSEGGELESLRKLLTTIAYNPNLLEGEYVYLAARCLLECQNHQRDLADIRQHVIRALGWRARSNNEVRATYRVLATQLLSRLADPDTVVNLAEIVYRKARLNLGEMDDYEYSSVRMAAAIGLKRMKSRKKVDETLAAIHPDLVNLFYRWEENDSEALIAQFENSDDAGIQALTALALGDVASQSTLSQVSLGKKDVLASLKSAFLAEGTQSAVRWAVTDALAMIDTDTVNREIIQPALAALGDRPAAELEGWLGRDKCLAYLIGLVRTLAPETHAFLVGYCLGSTRDLRLWLTAIEALGSLGNLEHRQLLAELALGRFGDQKLEEYFPDEDERYQIRLRAIEVLSEIGDQAIARSLREGGLEQDERLAQSYYQATSAIYQRLA